MSDKSLDCVIMGGGPAGATVATVLAQLGRRVRVLEKRLFPRPHIGESLVPHTYWTFKRLGMLDKLRRSDFPKKQSVQFVSASGSESQPFYFPDFDPGEHSTTWQVPRPEFDKMMLDNTRDHGVEVTEGAIVESVLFEGERAVGVRAVVDGIAQEIPAKVVVDATGQSAMLSRQLKMRDMDSKLKNASIYAYFNGAARHRGRHPGAPRSMVARTRPLIATDTTATAANPASATRGAAPSTRATATARVKTCPTICTLRWMNP